MMIRNLYDLLHILLKQECKSQVKRQKTKLLIYDIYLKKYVRADELLVPRTTKDSIQCLESWNKSKNFMLFDLLLKKFINPKLDLLNPPVANIKSKVWLCNTIHGCRYASTIKEFWDKRPGNSSGNVPALPSSTVGDKSFGWAGQVLSTPQSNPRPEYSTSTESGNHVEKTNRRNLKEGSIEKKEDLTNHYKKVLRNNVISRDGKSEKKKKNLLTISLKPQKEIKLQNKLKGKLFSNKLNAKSNILEKNANTLAKTEEENKISNADMVEIKPSTREKGSLLKKIYSQMISFKKSRKTEGQDNLNIKSNTDLCKNENIIPANISHDEGSGDKNVINTAKDTQENHHMVQNIESSESGKTTDINLAERKLEKKVLMAKKTMSRNLKMYQKKNSLAKNKISNSQKLSRNDNSTINDRHKFLNKPSLMPKTIVKESDSKLPINMKENTIQTLLGSESKNNNVNHIKKENGTLKTTSSHQKMANLVNRYAESNHSIAKNETSSPPNNSLESKLTPIIKESSLTYKSEGCHLKNCEENLDENLIETHKTPHAFNFSKNKKFIDKNSKNLQTIEFSENKKGDTLSNTERSGEKLNDKARVKNAKVEVSFESTRNIKGKTGTSIEGNLKMSQDMNSSRSNKDNGSEKSSENIVERRGDKEVGKFTKEAISAKPTGKLDKSIKDNSTIIQSSENKENVAHSNTSEVNLEQSDNKDIAIKVAQEVVSVKPIENIKGNTETNIEGNFDISKTITSRSKKDIACNNTFENNKKAEKRGKEMNFKTTTNLEGNQEKIVKDNFRVPQIITGCDRKNGDSNDNIFDSNIGRTVDKEIDKDTQKVVSFKNTEIVGDKSDVNGSENKQSIAHKSSLEKPSEGNKELTGTIHDLAVFETSENLETKSENNVEKPPKLSKTISDSHKTCVLNNNTLEKRDKEVNKTVTNFVNFKNIDFINKTAKNFNKIAEMKLDKSIKNNLKVSQASIGNNKNKVIYYDKSLQNSSKIRDKSTVKAVENVLGFETSGITNANYSNSNINSGQTEAKKQEIEVIEDCKNSFNDGLSKKTVCELKNNKTVSQQDHTNTTDSINKIETINSNSLLCQATNCKAVTITQEKNQQDKNNFLDKMPANTMSTSPTKVEQEISHKMARNKNTRPGENFENYTLDKKTLKGLAEMKKSKKAKQVSSIFNLNSGKIDKTFNKSREESNDKISKKVKNSNLLGKDNTEKVQFKSNGIDPKYTDKLHAISAQGKQLEDFALDGDLNKFKVNNYRGFKIAKVKSDTQLTNQNSSVQSRLKRSLERNISHPRVKGSNTELINSSQSQTREKSQEFKKQAKTLTGPKQIFHQFKKPNVVKKVIPHKLCSDGLSRNINESKFTEKISTSPISGESKGSNSQESKNWISSKALPQNSTLLKESERQRKENDKSLSKNIDKPNNLNKSIMPKSNSTHGPYNIVTNNSVPLPSKKLLVERNKAIKNIQGTIINENKEKIKNEIDKNLEAKNAKVQKEGSKPQQSNKNTEEESFDSSTKVINKNAPKMNSLKENEDEENTEKPSSLLPKQSKRKIHLIENKVDPKIRHKYSRRKPMKPIKIFKYSGKKSRKLKIPKAVETKNIYNENKKENDSLKLINDEAETIMISNKKAKVLDKTIEPVSKTQLHKQLRNKSVEVLSEENPDRKENKEKCIRKSKSVDSIKKINLDKYLRKMKKSAQRKKTKIKKPQSESASKDKLTGKGFSLFENTPDYEKKPEVSTSKKIDGYLNSKTKSRIYSQRSRKKTVIVGALKTRSSPELLNQIEETKNTMKSVSNDMSTKKRSISPQKQSKIRSYFEQRNKKPNGSSGIAHRGKSEFEKGNTVSSELEMKQTKTDEAIIDLKNNNITKTVFLKQMDDTGNVTIKEDVITKYKEKLTNTSISSKFKDSKVIDSSENKDNENEPIKNGMDSGFKIKAVKSTSSVANKNQNSNETKASKRTSSLNKVNIDKTEQVSLIQEEKIMNKYPHESISLLDKMLSKEMLNKRKSKSGKQNKTEETQMVISMKQSEPKPPTTQWKSRNQENKKLLNTTKNNTISRNDGNKSLAINMKPEERIKDLGDNSFSIKEIKKDGTKKSIALESYLKKHVKIPELNTNQENKPQDYNKVENESDELSGRLETKTITSNLNNANYRRIDKNRHDMFEYEKSDDIDNAFRKNPNPQGMHGITILDSSKPQNNREQLIKVRDNKQKLSNALQPSTIEQFSKQQLIVEGNKIKTSSFNSQKAEFCPIGAEKGEGDKSKVLKKEINAKTNTTKLLNNMTHRLNRSTQQNIVKKSDTNSSNTELSFQKFTNNSIANKTDNAVKSVGEKKFSTVKNISQSSNKDKREISTIKIVGTEKNMKMRNSYSDFKHKLNTPEEKKRIPLSKSQLKLKNETNESKNDLVLNNDKYFTNSKLLKKLSSTKSQIENNDLMVKGEVPKIDSSKRPSTAPGIKKYVTNIPSLNKPKIGGNLKLVKTKSHDDKNLKVNYVKSTGINILNSKVIKNESNGTAISKKEGEINNVNKTSSMNNISPDIKRKLSYLAKSALSTKFAIKETKLSLKKTGQLVIQNELAELKNDMFQGSEVIDTYSKVKIKERKQEPSNIDKPHSRTKIQTTETLKPLKSAIVSPSKEEYLKERRKVFTNILKEDKINSTAKTKVQNGNQHEELIPKLTTLIMEDIVSNNITKHKQAKTFSGDSILSKLSKSACSHLKNELVDSKINNNHSGEQGNRKMEKDLIQNNENEQSINNLDSMKISKKHSSSTQNIHPDLVEKSANMPVMRKKKTEIKPPKTDVMLE